MNCRHKKTAAEAAVLVHRRRLERTDLRGLHALGAADRFVLNFLTFGEGLEARALDLFEVREKIFAAF